MILVHFPPFISGFIKYQTKISYSFIERMGNSESFSTHIFKFSIQILIIWPTNLTLHIRGTVSAKFGPSFGRVSVKFWPSLGRVSAESWPSLGLVSAESRPSSLGRVSVGFHPSLG